LRQKTQSMPEKESVERFDDEIVSRVFTMHAAVFVCQRRARLSCHTDLTASPISTYHARMAAATQATHTIVLQTSDSHQRTHTVPNIVGPTPTGDISFVSKQGSKNSGKQCPI
jgi:hypothetical protein